MKKILLLSVNPKGTHQLRLDEEFREIQEAFKRSKDREKFEIYMSLATRVSDLRRALLKYEPTIVHFSGHGSGKDGLVLENELGQQQLVSNQSLTNLFKLFQTTVECVLLNACHSESQAQGIYESIDYVITMQKAIGDRAAIKFSLGFYDALGTGIPYERCFEIGKASIDLEGIPESEIPKIRYRNRSSTLKPEVEKLSKPEKEKPEKLVSNRGLKQNVSRAQIYGGMIASQGTNNQQTSTTKFDSSSQNQQLTQAEAVQLLNQLEFLIKTTPDLSQFTSDKSIKYLTVALEEAEASDGDKALIKGNLKRMVNLLKTELENITTLDSFWAKFDSILTQLLNWVEVY